MVSIQAMVSREIRDDAIHDCVGETRADRYPVCERCHPLAALGSDELMNRAQVSHTE
jgi:hypothetical protein